MHSVLHLLAMYRAIYLLSGNQSLTLCVGFWPWPFIALELPAVSSYSKYYKQFLASGLCHHPY
ncbi:hypothetical protein BDV09DRAFT_22298 [Aspergillus tetrazonus]